MGPEKFLQFQGGPRPIRESATRSIWKTWGRVVITQNEGGKEIAYPDTVVGTDSHTPMINGVGVMGWGVGGIEAEAVMLGQPYYMSIPEVIGGQPHRQAETRGYRHGPGAYHHRDVA